ncbi:MAG: hypothetical protein ABFR97_05065 [Thermodesulfobacteriota bacterium]
MKVLHVMRTAEPTDDVKKLIDIVSEGRDNESFNLDVAEPDYAKLIDMVYDADQTICWW